LGDRRKKKLSRREHEKGKPIKKKLRRDKTKKTGGKERSYLFVTRMALNVEKGKQYL